MYANIQLLYLGIAGNAELQNILLNIVSSCHAEQFPIWSYCVADKGALLQRLP